MCSGPHVYAGAEPRRRDLPLALKEYMIYFFFCNASYWDPSRRRWASQPPPPLRAWVDPRGRGGSRLGGAPQPGAGPDASFRRWLHTPRSAARTTCLRTHVGHRKPPHPRRPRGPLDAGIDRLRLVSRHLSEHAERARRRGASRSRGRGPLRFGGSRARHARASPGLHEAFRRPRGGRHRRSRRARPFRRAARACSTRRFPERTTTTASSTRRRCSPSRRREMWRG